jgi:hypothetical protein
MTTLTINEIAICSGSKKSMEILFNVQPKLPSKNKVVPDLSEHDSTLNLTFCKITNLLFFHFN